MLQSGTSSFMDSLIVLPGVTEEGTATVGVWYDYSEMGELTHEDKKAKAIANCGKWNSYIDPLTGVKRTARRFCNYADSCSICHERRVEKYRSRIAACSSLEVGYAVVSAEEWPNLMRGIADSTKYLRLPQEDGNSVVFFDISVAKGEPMPIKAALELDWSTMTTTPKGQRITGALGKGDEPAPLQAVGKVETYEYLITDKDNRPITTTANDECYYLAIEATAHLDPQNIDEVQDAIVQRANAYETELTKHGFKYEVRERTLKINSDKYNWSIYTEIILRTKSMKDIVYHADKRTVDKFAPVAEYYECYRDAEVDFGA